MIVIKNQTIAIYLWSSIYNVMALWGRDQTLCDDSIERSLCTIKCDNGESKIILNRVTLLMNDRIAEIAITMLLYNQPEQEG